MASQQSEVSNRRSKARRHLASLSVWALFFVLGHAPAITAQPSPPPPVKATNPELGRQLPPVQYFRVLLAMKPAERTAALSKEPAEQQTAMLAKLREYDGLPVDARELRLHETELRWQLLDAMKTPPAARAAKLASLAPKDRELLTNRLAEWDKWSPEAQKEFLDNQDSVALWLRLQSGFTGDAQRILSGLSPERRRAMETELKKWANLPAGQRAELTSQFQHFSALDDQAQQKTLNVLSDAERQQMEKTLKLFSILPPELRERSISAFGKFATMSPAERDEFLVNAARWEAMSPRDRTVWTYFVQHPPPMPPMPPIKARGPIRMPPLPPGLTPGMRADLPFPPGFVPLKVASPTNNPGQITNAGR